MGASIRSFLIDAKERLASTNHLISPPFLSIKVIILTSSAKSGTNLLKKLILPQKDWISFLFLGNAIFWMKKNLIGSILIPSKDIMWPNILPCSIENNDFLGFNDIPNLLHFLNMSYLKCYRSWSPELEKIVMSSR